MFYIYSSKGWAREMPTKNGNWFGSFATARAIASADEAARVLRHAQLWLPEFRNAVIMEVKQL